MVRWKEEVTRNIQITKWKLNSEQDGEIGERQIVKRFDIIYIYLFISSYLFTFLLSLQWGGSRQGDENSTLWPRKNIKRIIKFLQHEYVNGSQSNGINIIRYSNYARRSEKKGNLTFKNGRSNSMLLFCILFLLYMACFDYRRRGLFSLDSIPLQSELIKKNFSRFFSGPFSRFPCSRHRRDPHSHIFHGFPHDAIN